MELTNEFSVGVPIDLAWAVLTDLERIVPCMPGAELQEIEGDEYRGLIRVKVGPMTARYEGVASFQERDEGRHRVVVRADGRDTRGQGNARATVTATLESESGGTRVTVHTNLKITGKVAQFGRGVLADVSSKLLGQFVQTLEADVLTGAARSGATPALPGPATESDPRQIEPEPAGPIDLTASVGSSVIKRVVPLVIVILALLWLVGRC